MKVVTYAIFVKIEICNFFLCELPLILRVDWKRKTTSRYLQRTLRYQISRRMVNWFRFYVRRRVTTVTQKIKYILLASGNFKEKADSVTFLGFEHTINLENVIKIVVVSFHFLGNQNLFFFFSEKGWSKTKILPRNICRRSLHIWFERDWSVGLDAMLGDGHTEN